jgi:DNA-binding NarL/FixJ family response regulator
MILTVVEDLIFLSKIQQTAQAFGVEIETTEPRQVADRVGRGSVGALIIDLNHRSGAAVEVIRALKANPLTEPIRVVGFLSHVQADLATAAREAGCDQVMARSAFTQQLPQLLQKLAGKQAAPASQA